MSGLSDLEHVVIEAVQEEFENKAIEFQEIMGNEINSRSGNLKSRMTHEKLSDTSYFVGIGPNSGGDFDYAEIYWKGRGEVRPKKKKALRYETRSGEVVFSQYSRATKGDKFVERAISKFK